MIDQAAVCRDVLARTLDIPDWDYWTTRDGIVRHVQAQARHELSLWRYWLGTNQDRVLANRRAARQHGPVWPVPAEFRIAAE